MTRPTTLQHLHHRHFTNATNCCIFRPFAVTRPPSKELLEAIKEGEELAHDPNAKTYASPQELWDELGI